MRGLDARLDPVCALQRFQGSRRRSDAELVRADDRVNLDVPVVDRFDGPIDAFVQFRLGLVQVDHDLCRLDVSRDCGRTVQHGDRRAGEKRSIGALSVVGVVGVYYDD